MKVCYSHAVLLARFDNMCKMIPLECYRRNVVDPALLTVHPVLFQLPSAQTSLPAMYLHVVQKKITAPRTQDELSCGY